MLRGIGVLPDQLEAARDDGERVVDLVRRRVGQVMSSMIPSQYSSSPSRTARAVIRTQTVPPSPVRSWARKSRATPAAGLVEQLDGGRLGAGEVSHLAGDVPKRLGEIRLGRQDAGDRDEGLGPAQGSEGFERRASVAPVAPRRSRQRAWRDARGRSCDTRSSPA